MTLGKFLLAFLLSGLLVPSAALALSDAAPMPEWMTGSWVYSDEAGWSEEYWTTLRGDIMLGSSRSGSGNRLDFWEQMRIQKEADGTVAFWAVTADQNPVRFELVVSMDNEVVFENAEHDYPQRIRYWREGVALKAEISLLDGSKAVQFTYSSMD